MNKTELVAAIATNAGLTKASSEAALKAIINAVTEALKSGDKVSLIGFGTFDVVERKARTAKVPGTGKTVKVPASKAPKFKAGKGLKDAVNTKATAKKPAAKSKKK